MAGAIIGGLLGLGGGIFDWFSNKGQADWRANFAREQLDRLNRTQEYAAQRISENFPWLMDRSRQAVEGAQDWLYNPEYGLSFGAGEAARNYLGTIQGDQSIYNRYDPTDPRTAFFQDPRITAYQEQVQNALGGGAAQQDIVNQILGGGYGGRWYSGIGLDRAGDIAQGIGPGQGIRRDVGEKLVGGTGYTQRQNDMWDTIAQAAGYQGYLPATQQAQENALQMALGGGYTPGIERLGSTGYNVLGGGGQTPVGAAGQAAALNEILGRGRTDLTDYMSGVSGDLAGREALLAPEEALSFARDAAARQARAKQAQLQRTALARGGAALSAGNRLEAFKGITDDALANEAALLQSTLQNQQALQLQQRGLGFEGLRGAQSAETAREGTYGDLLSRLEGTATQRFGIGGNLASEAEQIAAGRYGTGLSGVGNMENLAQQRLMSAFGLQRGLEQDALARQRYGSDLLSGLTAEQLGGIGALGNMSAADRAWTELGLQQGLAQQQFGLSGAQNLYNMYRGGQEGNLSRLGAGNTAFNTALGAMTGLGNQGLDWMRLGYGAQTPVFQGWQQGYFGAGTTNPAGPGDPFKSNIGGALGEFGKSIEKAVGGGDKQGGG